MDIHPDCVAANACKAHCLETQRRKAGWGCLLCHGPADDLRARVDAASARELATETDAERAEREALVAILRGDG